MKSGLPLLTVVLLGLTIGACGETRTSTGTELGSSRAAAVGGASSGAGSTTTRSAGRLRGDEDDDDTTEDETSGNELDSDNDKDDDAKDNRGKGYYDADDSTVRDYGHAADPSDTQALTALVRRYYAAATAENGAVGCALTFPTRANSLPEDYGPAYLPNAKTCAEVLTVVFKRLRAQIPSHIEVTAVRVDGDRADVLLGSATMPASVIEAEREHGAWKIDRVLAASLP